jgi:hypothetical protein
LKRSVAPTSAPPVLVANLLVVLCGDQRATPVVNTGTTYS